MDLLHLKFVKRKIARKMLSQANHKQKYRDITAEYETKTTKLLFIPFDETDEDSMSNSYEQP
jgi:hypothetical protein